MQLKIIFQICQPKQNVVGTQKKPLNETVLLSTKNKMFKLKASKVITILHPKTSVYRDVYGPSYYSFIGLDLSVILFIYSYPSV